MNHPPLRRIVFVCAHNSCRGPMAVGFARQKGRGGIEFLNAGLQPRGKVDPLTVHVMRRAGVDISDLPSPALTDALARSADLLVLLSGPDEFVGPLPEPQKFIHWAVEDPLGWPVEEYERALDEVRRLVDLLLDWVRDEAEANALPSSAPDLVAAE